MRLIIAALGPKALEQTHIANDVPWEEMPTHERSKRWFEKQWIPLCEHMYIDPYDKPRYLDSLCFHSFYQKEWETNKPEEESRTYWEMRNELHGKFANAPWSAEEHPAVAQWLEERSPILDLFGVAVRKPNFACYRWRPDDEWGLLGILLPDVQSNREFARDLQVRIGERLGEGDIDGAWYDVMSMFYLSRKHYVHDPFLVVNLVGIAAETMGGESVKVILQQSNLTPKQLERFAQDLESLPRTMVLDTTWEKNVLYSMLAPDFKLPPLSGISANGSTWDLPPPEYFSLRYLPFDRNIAGKRIAEFNNVERRVSGDEAWNINWTVMKKYNEERDKLGREKNRQLDNPLSVLRIPLIRTRSELIADSLIVNFTTALHSTHIALNRANARFDLLRLAIALERYKSANAEYPETLDALIPKYLEEIPLDVFTGRKTLTYKLAPDEATAYLLYSYGENETDNGGDEKEDIVLRMTVK
jgi:hypothetical protein